MNENPMQKIKENEKPNLQEKKKQKIIIKINSKDVNQNSITQKQRHHCLRLVLT
jgi:hypothetical protein